MKQILVALAFILFSSTIFACPCPTSGTLGDSAVVIRDITITAAIDFTGAGEPTTPVALGFYLSTSNVTKISPAATFVKGQLYRYNTGNWELVLLGASGTGKIGATNYSYGGVIWEQLPIETIQQYANPMGGVSPYVATPGIAALSWTPLAANATWSSGWIDLSNYQSVMMAYNADVAGTLLFEYSNDGVSAFAGGTTNLVYPPSGISLNGQVVNHFPTTKAKYFRLQFTNGPAPQTSFNAMIRLSLDASVSAQTLSAVTFDSAIAQITKAVIATPDSGGTYGKITRTGTALDVNITNSAGGGLTDAQLRATAVPVTVGNFPATQPVSGTFWQATQPVSGSVTATISGTPAVTISELAKTAVQRTGTLVTTATTADQVVATYTVTAGKTFYLQYLSMQGSLTALSAVASIMGVISLERPSGTKVVSFRAVNPTVSVHPVFTLDQGTVPIPAGTVIRVVVTPAAATSMTWIANFGGFEQ